METIVERPAALDVHRAQVTACVRVPRDVEAQGRRGRPAGGRFTARPDRGGVASPYTYFPVALAIVIGGSVIAAESASGHYPICVLTSR